MCRIFVRIPVLKGCALSGIPGEEHLLAGETMSSPITSSKKTKRKRTQTSTPPTKQGKKSKDGDPFVTQNRSDGSICSICDEIILEPIEEEQMGHDAVYCEGICQCWLHRKCAGLSKQTFDALGESDDPYHCTHCTLIAQQKEISDLKEQVKSLSSQLENLTNKSVPASEHTNSESGVTLDKQGQSTVPVSAYEERTKSAPTRNSTLASEKKFNVIVYGVKECPSNTPRSDRLQTELSSVIDIFSSLDSSIQTNAIKDHFRLGKYSIDHQRPRPILVKFLRSTDALSLLSKKRDLHPPTFIKPDMTKQERLTEQLLLKQRWQLLQQGYNRKQIKLRRNCLLINNKVYAKVSENNLIVSSTSTDTDTRSASTPQSTSPQQMTPGSSPPTNSN